MTAILYPANGVIDLLCLAVTRRARNCWPRWASTYSASPLCPSAVPRPIFLLNRLRRACGPMSTAVSYHEAMEWSWHGCLNAR